MNRRKKLGKFFTAPVVVAMIVLGIVILATVCASLIAQYDPNQIDMAKSLQNPSLEHWLGTDKTGRDIFSRLLYGGRTTLLSAFAVVFVSVVIGVPIGLF